MENQSIWQDAYQIIDNSVKAVLPSSAVRTALQGHPFSQGVYVVAVGKAAWEMSKTAKEILGGAIVKGIVLTKYGHGKGSLPGFEILEAGHPIPDQNSCNRHKKNSRDGTWPWRTGPGIVFAFRRWFRFI